MSRNGIMAIMMCVMTSTASGADRANAVQKQVWGQYLAHDERAALAAMIPEKADAAVPEDKTVLERVQEFREAFLNMAAEYARALDDVPTTNHDASGIRGSWITPVDANPERVLLYLHGGAYVFGSDKTPRAITAYLSREAKIRCFSLDYPLAPEHPFPAAVDNAIQAYRMLLDQGVNPGNIVLGGDSAGGGLTLALLLGIRENTLPMPAGAYLISPWTDLTQSFETHIVKSAVDISITDEFLKDPATYYVGGRDRTNPLISPAYGSFRGLPPLLIQVGSHERLLDDSLTIARNTALDDVPVTLTVWPGYPHVFQFYHRDLMGSGKALCEAGEFINAVIEQRIFQ